MKGEQRIDDTEFLVVDVETTGLSPVGGDRVCEIGAVRLRGGAVIETFGSLIDPRRPVSPGAFAVNRISPAMLLDAPVFDDVVTKLRGMMEDAVLVAYNAPFDLSFLRSEFALVGAPAPRNVVVDALALARQLLPGLGKYSQDNVARMIGIPFAVKHRALEDALVTSKIFAILTSMLKAHDCTTVADLHRRDLGQALQQKRIGIVNDALAAGSNLWIKYFSPAEAAITDRIVTPKDCFVDKFSPNGAATLVGFCHTTGTDLQFRVERILDLRMLAKS
jgi:DNA polymerase III epsilon subunit family exonuclease